MYNGVPGCRAGSVKRAVPQRLVIAEVETVSGNIVAARRYWCDSHCACTMKEHRRRAFGFWVVSIY